jgi:hypothetical protein
MPKNDDFVFQWHSDHSHMSENDDFGLSGHSRHSHMSGK